MQIIIWNQIFCAKLTNTIPISWLFDCFCIITYKYQQPFIMITNVNTLCTATTAFVKIENIVKMQISLLINFSTCSAQTLDSMNFDAWWLMALSKEYYELCIVCHRFCFHTTCHDSQETDVKDNCWCFPWKRRLEQTWLPHSIQSDLLLLFDVYNRRIKSLLRLDLKVTKMMIVLLLEITLIYFFSPYYTNSLPSSKPSRL